jgi:ABC-type proline/glycine betaine transport system ATPase subunit
MTNNTLKSTIETIRATNALIVVTLDGTFNSQTGAPVLSVRTRPDQRNKFLKDFCEKVSPSDAKEAASMLQTQIAAAKQEIQTALDSEDYAAILTSTKRAIDLTEQADQPRVYYRLKENLDLRSVAEKRAAKKAENEAKKVAKQAEKEAKVAEKMAAKVERQTNAEPFAEPVENVEPHATKKGGKKVA